MAQECMFTGGYVWAPASRMRGDPNKVAATLASLKDANGRVDVDAIKAAWQRKDVALRETMGDEAHVLDVGLDAQAYKILRSLEYEVVNVVTEETAPGGRVFRTVQDLTGDPESPARVFVQMPPEAIPLRRLSGPSYQPPPTPVQRPATPAPLPSLPWPPAKPEPPDRDMEAWLALQAWCDRYGDIPRYQPIIAAIKALD